MRIVPFFALLIASGCTTEQSAALPFGTEATNCATCHEVEYEAWSSSPHATSGTSPVFEALVAEVGERWGERAADACIDCHQPGHGGDVGVGCVTCHAATGNTGERDGRLRVDLELPLAGPRGEGTNGAHAIRATGFLTSPSLCGTCHEVTSPGLLDEPTLTEYRESDLAAAGVSCATCHMPEGEHRFVGIDPAWGQNEETRARAVEDARALMDEALALSARVEGDELSITVENVGAGHSVPTGAAFLRDVWVDVSFDGVETRVHSFGAQPTRGGAPVALLTDADAITHRSLAAGEAREERVPIPVDADEIVVTLRLRAIGWEVLDALGLQTRQSEVPTIDVERIVLAR
jgi:hypothetical protein